MKKALVTGVTGQDGSYLAELLLEHGYEVHGLTRRSSSLELSHIGHLVEDPKIFDQRLFLHTADLSDSLTLYELIRNIKPHEVYNLAAQSHVRTSFDIPEHTVDVTGTGTLRLLDAIVKSGVPARFYQASSSEMFGAAQHWPQNETTPFYPRSPYGCAKVFAHWATINYREAYGLHASTGILFNHESPRRGTDFVTRKITRAVARILAGKQDTLVLGNLDAERDWGFAKDYVEAIWLMVQAQSPDDYVIGTGITRSIRDFLELAFDRAGLDWQNHVKTDPKYFRPTEPYRLVADPSKAQDKLGWKPKTSFAELVRIMVDADLKLEGIDPASVQPRVKATEKKAA